MNDGGEILKLEEEKAKLEQEITGLKKELNSMGYNNRKREFVKKGSIEEEIKDLTIEKEYIKKI